MGLQEFLPDFFEVPAPGKHLPQCAQKVQKFPRKSFAPGCFALLPGMGNCGACLQPLQYCQAGRKKERIQSQGQKYYRQECAEQD